MQGFRNLDNTFLIKELAAFDGNNIHHTIFQPPHPFQDLPHHLQKTNKWLTTHYHNLEWCDGDTPYKKFIPILQQIANVRDTIYVKGTEKCTFLKKIINDIPIIELPEKSRLQKDTPQCMFHKNGLLTMCAVTNVIFLYNNFLKNKSYTIH